MRLKKRVHPPKYSFKKGYAKSSYWLLLARLQLRTIYFTDLCSFISSLIFVFYCCWVFFFTIKHFTALEKGSLFWPSKLLYFCTIEFTSEKFQVFCGFPVVDALSRVDVKRNNAPVTTLTGSVIRTCAEAVELVILFLTTYEFTWTIKVWCKCFSGFRNQHNYLLEHKYPARSWKG